MEAIGQLAGGIAHDFNNLLTTILGYCELLSARRGKAGADRQIEQIAKAGRRAAALTSQLLAFSRKQVLQARVIDLNAVIAGMRGMLERLISEDVTLVIDLASDLKPVEADPGQIEQVIMNLVVNARDAMPRGGRLKIATRNVDVDGEDASPTSVQTSAEVAVSDTGDGMDAETLQKIFDPFFTTKAPGAGTGLGLSTVHGVVTQSGGEIIASSQPLAGSTFRVRLPHVERALTELSDETAVATPMLDGRERILLVEDDDGVRDLARTILESAGYRVLEASRAATAFEIAETALDRPPRHRCRDARRERPRARRAHDAPARVSESPVHLGLCQRRRLARQDAFRSYAPVGEAVHWSAIVAIRAPVSPFSMPRTRTTLVHELVTRVTLG